MEGKALIVKRVSYDECQVTQSLACSSALERGCGMSARSRRVDDCTLFLCIYVALDGRRPFSLVLSLCSLSCSSATTVLFSATPHTDVQFPAVGS